MSPNVETAPEDDALTENIVFNGVTFFHPTRAREEQPTFQRLRHELRLFDHSGEQVGVVNRYGVLAAATKTPEGLWYSYGNPKIIGEYGWLASRDDIRRVAKSVTWGPGDPFFTFC